MLLWINDVSPIAGQYSITRKDDVINRRFFRELEPTFGIGDTNVASL